MESISDIDLLQDRPLFKMGLIAHDYRKTVIASVLIICFSLGSLTVLLTPDWVESFGEGDMESVDAFGIMGESFGEVDAENTEVFYILVRHEISYDDQRIQDAVRTILEPIRDERSVSITIFSKMFSYLITTQMSFARKLVFYNFNHLLNCADAS